MTALELNAELFRQLSIIAEDETLMRKAVEAIRKDGSEVLGMVAIFTYGFTIAEDKFKNAKVNVNTANDNGDSSVVKTTVIYGENQKASIDYQLNKSGVEYNRKVIIFYLDQALELNRIVRDL